MIYGHFSHPKDKSHKIFIAPFFEPNNFFLNIYLDQGSSSERQFKSAYQKFLRRKLKKSATKGSQIGKKEKENRRSSKIKMCHQNKKMTNNKQNCSHKVKKKERKIVFQKPIIDDLCSKVITHKHLSGL